MFFPTETLCFRSLKPAHSCPLNRGSDSSQLRSQSLLIVTVTEQIQEQNTYVVLVEQI